MRTIRWASAEQTPVAGPVASSSAAPAGASGRLTRGNKITLGVFFTVLALLVLGSLVRLPYAVLSPGPIVNTLGEQTKGTTKTPLIRIAGLPTYPTRGTLDFTTVSIEGGPGYPVDLWDLLTALVDRDRDVVPVDTVFPPDVTKEQVAEQNAVQMQGSQQEATAVALRAIGKSVPAHIAIASFADTSKAKGLLKVGDRFVRIGETRIESDTRVPIRALQSVKPGDSVRVVVAREDKDVSVAVPTIAVEGRTALGVRLALVHDFPAAVTIDAGSVGGPSAGLMFALGIYDKLTPGALTGDHRIAGTGEIDDAGTVGAIGGIQQKLAGARGGGAEYFLAPADNCSEVVGNVPDGLQVFRVATFTEARAAVEGIAADRTEALPRC